MADYILADCTYDSKGTTSNLHRHTFWFPPTTVAKGDRVVLLTGKGKDATTREAGEPAEHRFYWGLSAAVWNDDGDKVTLIRIAAHKSVGFARKA
ncbi:hypothetical protein [Phenylobacterium deserti]|uniref:hypothetical protein n=1 Tax=Phenylobacterium deserti TaxID=1914756 RepID=UPI001057D560|nr:hypothetical protein [Phenylobacterium deserti]